jgi:ATP-binding protein involved in chromosome partitioning
VPLLGKVPLTMPLRAQADVGEPLVSVDPDDAAAQAIRQAARGLLALFPAPLPVLGMAPAGQQAEAAVSGFQLPMVQA